MLIEGLFKRSIFFDIMLLLSSIFLIILDKKLLFKSSNFSTLLDLPTLFKSIRC